MAFTLAQVSDAHLGALTPLFRGNFARIAAVLETLRPDLIVATGDMSLDGADREADLTFAAGAFQELPGPVHAVPGNHDVGDHPEFAPEQPVNDARLARFRRHFGRDRWVVDHAGWRLLGLNSQIMGAHPEEHAQAAMIEDALRTLGDRRLAVFIHKPLFITDPHETAFDYWSVPPCALAPLRPVLAHPALRLVASGHLHVHHVFSRDGVKFAWAPSTAFIVAPQQQPGMPGARPCGILLHRFENDAVQTGLLAPGGMERLWIHDVGAEAYPPAQAPPGTGPDD